MQLLYSFQPSDNQKEVLAHEVTQIRWEANNIAIYKQGSSNDIYGQAVDASGQGIGAQKLLISSANVQRRAPERTSADDEGEDDANWVKVMLDQLEQYRDDYFSPDQSKRAKMWNNITTHINTTCNANKSRQTIQSRLRTLVSRWKKARDANLGIAPGSSGGKFKTSEHYDFFTNFFSDNNGIDPDVTAEVGTGPMTIAKVIFNLFN